MSLPVGQFLLFPLILSCYLEPTPIPQRVFQTWRMSFQFVCLANRPHLDCKAVEAPTNEFIALEEASER